MGEARQWAGEWWREAVIYQIYPSFVSGHGRRRRWQRRWGDFARPPGYLEWLGVDAIWLSPINPSPMADYGDANVSLCIGIEQKIRAKRTPAGTRPDAAR